MFLESSSPIFVALEKLRFVLGYLSISLVLPKESDTAEFEIDEFLDYFRQDIKNCLNGKFIINDELKLTNPNLLVLTIINLLIPYFDKKGNSLPSNQFDGYESARHSKELNFFCG